jgi:hypothetical protein
MKIMKIMFFFANMKIVYQLSSLTYSGQKSSPCLEQLQQFGKPTWHPYNFGKTQKIGLQQFGKPTWQK